MENAIKYSILIPAYNAEKYIARSLKSVLNQKSNYNYEIIVCDDGSTDDTAKIVNEIKNEKVRLINNDTNKGGIISRKRLILEASGDYIVWLDADDECSLDMLSVLDEYVSNNTYDIISIPYCCVSGVERTKDNQNHCSQNNESIFQEHLLDKFFSLSLQWNLWNKVFKREILLKRLPPNWNFVIDDVFFTLPAFYYAQNYISINTHSLYYYYYGIGYWTGDFYKKKREFNLDEFKKSFEARVAEYQYNMMFLAEHNLRQKYSSQLYKACDLNSILYHLIKIADFDERECALSILYNVFNVDIKFYYDI